MSENQISYLIRGCAFKVHKELGPGLFESVYKNALGYELEKENLQVRMEVGVPMVYKELKFNEGYRMDILVGEKVIVEVKSVESLHDLHFKQLLTYLRLADKRLGLLINFNATRLEDRSSIIRILNGTIDL